MTSKSPTGRTLSLPEPQRIETQKMLADPNQGGQIIGGDLSHAEQRIVAHMLGGKPPKGTDSVRKAYGVGFKHKEHTINGARPVSFEDACARYVERFTMDHVPAWANKPVARADGKYPGPHYASDLEWYKNTEFPDKGDRRRYCRSLRQTYPLGKWLDKPFKDMRLGDDLAKVLAVTEKNIPDPRAIKRAEGRRKKRLAQFEITAINPVMEAIRNHQPEPKPAKKVPTLQEMLHADVNKNKSRKPKTKSQRKGKPANKGRPTKK